MATFVARRLLLLVPVLLGVSVITFSLMHVTPGDPVDIMLGERASRADRELLRRQYHLDRPLGEQLGRYLAGVVRGDLGRSFATRREVSDLVAERFPRTLLLAVTAPDPGSTPDCEMASPRGFWINTLDSQMDHRDVARLLGSMLGVIEMIEHDYTMEFGEEIRELIDDARGSGHAMRWNIVPTESTDARPWSRSAGSR